MASSYTCIRFDTIPACDGRTDRNAIANTALSIDMRYKTRKTSYTQTLHITNIACMV